MPGYSLLLLFFAGCICTSAGIDAECISDEGDECMMSSLLLQTESSMGKSQPLASPTNVRAAKIAHELAAVNMAYAEQLLSHLGNVTSALDEIMTSLDDDQITFKELRATEEDIFHVRDVILLAVRSKGSPADLAKLSPVGVTLTHAARDIADLRLMHAKDAIKGVVGLLSQVSLPKGKDVYEFLKQQDPTLPAENIFYGNWCGRFKPSGADCSNVKDCHMPPIDGLDTCCKAHDVSYAEAYPKLHCEKQTRGGGKPDCELYDIDACEQLVGYDQKLAECATFTECPDADQDCIRSKQQIMELYGSSSGHYSACEVACPAIPRFHKKHR